MTDTQPATPRAASTLILLRDDPFQVLMVKRNGRGQYGDTLVFPGGTVDSDDADSAWLPLLESGASLEEAERAHRIAAVREGFEESGLLFANGQFSQPTDRDANFRDVVDDSLARLDLENLVPFAHWITPVFAPKRFDTRFYVAEAPDGQVPSHDGSETVSLEWVEPARVYDEAAGLPIQFVTRLQLMRLAESRSVADALVAARARPHFVVQPQMEKTETGRRLFIPEEAGYPVSEELINVPG